MKLTHETSTGSWLRIIIHALLTTIVALSVRAQTTSAPAAGQSQPATSTPSTAAPPEEVVKLSPFEVKAENIGYFAPNSMSGTRFNTKIEDMAASLTVVTTGQMDDFAMLDINDVFRYTAGTEGTGTYTDFVMDRNGQMFDNVQLSPTTANRIRGISSANTSYGNYETMNRMPIDRLIIDGLEVSRGPNANVFGLGNASGTVNQVPISANLQRNRAQVEFRADSYDGYRTSLDFNRVLLPNRLAVRASGAFQHEGFIRKPSGVNTVHYNGLIKYRPFKNTTISGAVLYYRMNGNRPNYTMPRDYISDWLNAGRPGWDPVAEVIHRNGQTIGPFTADTSTVNLSGVGTVGLNYFGISRAGGESTRSNIYIDQSGISYWSAPNATNPNSNPFTPAANGQAVRLMESSVNLGIATASPGRYTGQPLFTTTPVVSSKAVYDWSSINLSSVNRLMDQTTVYNVQLDQTILDTPRQMLAAQLGFFREDSERYQRTPIGNSNTSGQTGQLFIDVNEKNLDGSVNPFFGRPFIAVGEPITRWLPSTWDTYRAQMVYQLDLRHEKNWLKWLGLHQLSPYYEYKYRVNRSFGYRDVLSSDHSWTASAIAANQARATQSSVIGGPQAGPNIVRGYFRYYVGDANGGNIDYAPSDFRYGSYPFVWGGYRTVTGNIPNASTGVFVSDPATISQLASTDQTGGNNNLKQIIKTPGAVLQSHFLDDKLVTTFGLREDQVYSKNGYAIPNLVANNTQHDFATDNHWAAGDYRFNSGKTKTAGVVARPFRDLAFVNEAIAHGTGAERFFANVLRGLSFTYNKSDNFIPQPPAVDLYLQPLPNVTGKGTDYGFWLELGEGRFVMRVNRWTTTQYNARDGDANTVAQRVLRLDLDISNDNYQLYDRQDAWFRLLNPTWTDAQVRQAIADQMQIPIPTYNALVTNVRAGTIAATNDITATGTDIEINFNPTHFWTLAASLTEQKAINTNISNAVQQWIDQRMPVWTTIVDPNTNPNLGTGASQGWVADATNPNHLWWLHSYAGSQTPAQNYATFVAAPYAVIKQQEGKSKPSVRHYAFRLSTSYQLAGITENRIFKNIKIGGAARWDDKGAIGYYGVPDSNGIYQTLDANRPVWDPARWYFDAFIGYKTKLWGGRVVANFQLNVRDLTERGRLQAIGVFPDGTPNNYRIIDPRQFIFTASFDL